MAVAAAAPSGLLDGTIVIGPSGVVTNHGAVGHGVGLGLGHGAVIATPVVASPIIKTVVAEPVLGVSYGHNVVSHGLVGHGVTAVTNGGGVISASGHGAKVLGPPTAPVVVAGPSGKIAADGLWGPTGNIGLTGHHW